MADIRFKDLDEAASPGADYFVPTDSATDGVKKIKPSNLVTAADIGLGNVDNTADIDKPVSTAMQTALDLKATTTALGALAFKDVVAIADIGVAGTPSSSTYLRGDGAWTEVSGGSAPGEYDTAASAFFATESIFRTKGKLTPGDFGGAAYIVVDTDPSEEGAFVLDNGKWATLAELVVTPQMFLDGADAGDDALMTNRFFTYIASSKANGIFPPLDYLFKTQVSCTVPASRRMYVSAYNARFQTEGAIKAFYVTGGGYSGGGTFAGFMIDHTDNTDALYGWHLHAAGNVYIVEPDIPAGGTGETYAAAYIEGGSYWCQVIDPQIYSFNEATPVTYGVLIEGYANAAQVIGGKISEVTYPVFLGPVAAVGDTSSYAPNGVLVDRTNFEKCTYGVTFKGILGDANTRPVGLRVTSCRGETLTTFLHYMNVDQESESPTFLSGNMLLGVTNYYSGDVPIVSLDIYQPSLPKVSVSSPSATEAQFDSSSAPGYSVANGASASITPSLAGADTNILFIGETQASGKAAVYICSGGGAPILLGGAASYVVGDTPSAGQFGMAWDSGSNTYKIHNNVGLTAKFRVMLFRIG